MVSELNKRRVVHKKKGARFEHGGVLEESTSRGSKASSPSKRGETLDSTITDLSLSFVLADSTEAWRCVRILKEGGLTAGARRVDALNARRCKRLADALTYDAGINCFHHDPALFDALHDIAAAALCSDRQAKISMVTNRLVRHTLVGIEKALQAKRGVWSPVRTLCHAAGIHPTQASDAECIAAAISADVETLISREDRWDESTFVAVVLADNIDALQSMCRRCAPKPSFVSAAYSAAAMLGNANALKLLGPIHAANNPTDSTPWTLAVLCRQHHVVRWMENGSPGAVHDNWVTVAEATVCDSYAPFLKEESCADVLVIMCNALLFGNRFKATTCARRIFPSQTEADAFVDLFSTRYRRLFRNTLPR